jgi:hypothetical protein
MKSNSNTQAVAGLQIPPSFVSLDLLQIRTIFELHVSFCHVVLILPAYPRPSKMYAEMAQSGQQTRKSKSFGRSVESGLWRTG